MTLAKFIRIYRVDSEWYSIDYVPGQVRKNYGRQNWWQGLVVGSIEYMGVKH